MRQLIAKAVDVLARLGGRLRPGEHPGQPGQLGPVHSRQLGNLYHARDGFRIRYDPQ
jgi:hypothetical protein